MDTQTNLQQHYSRIYDVGIRGRVSFLYVDQSFKLLALNALVLNELTKIDEINLANNRLSLRDRLTNNRLQRLLSDVLSVDETNLHQVGGYLKVPTQGRDSVLISVFPCRQVDVNQGNRRQPDSQQARIAEIRISYPKQTNLDVFSRAMRDLYELSASESKVVSLLLQGRNTKEIASCLEVADSTLRTHLKHIFSKTQTRHQAELVSKILLCDTYVMPDVFA